MAAAAHPDDIEFMMSGTLMLLGDAGYRLHYMNIANGCCGSVTMSREKTVSTRTEEARRAAERIGAEYHYPLVDDIMLFYEDSLIRKLCAIVRKVNPEILLLPSPQDYMEDHMNASRVMVTAAFCRNMPNYPTDPPTDHIDSSMCIYHALPYGLMDQLRRPIRPDFFVDIGSVMDKKRDMLACHKSQKDWLDQSQGQDNYIKTMDAQCLRAGDLSGSFEYAEGWRRHSHMGFSAEEFDPLGEVLGKYIIHSNQGDN